MLDNQLLRLIEMAIAIDASDMQLSVGHRPSVRIDGQWRELHMNPLVADDTASVVHWLTPDRSREELDQQCRTEFGFAYGSPDGELKGRFRVAALRESELISVAFHKVKFFEGLQRNTRS